MQHTVRTAPTGAPIVPSDVGRWAACLTDFTRDLRRVAADSEREFVAAGARLQEFHARAAGVAADAAAIATDISGHDIAAARQRLAVLIDELGTFFERSGEALVAIEGTLADIAELLSRVQRHLDSFEKLIRKLRMLGVSTKIESSRLATANSGFDTLSANVSALSVRIDQRLSDVGDQKRVLVSQVAHALVRLREIGNTRGKEAREILEQARHALGALGESQEQGSRAADLVARRSAEIAANIAEIVVSMQFHDITRQEMEHAETGLHELRERLSAGGDDDLARLATDAAEVTSLQAAHLERATDSLTEAVMRIADNLGAMAPAVAATARETREASGLLDRGGHGVLADLERKLEPLVTKLAADAAAGEEMAAVMRGVAGATEKIAGFVADIEKVGAEIERIALNASIKAAHIGRDGTVLGVLAEAIQDLSADTREETAAVAGPLREVLSRAGSLEARVEQARGGHDAAAGATRFKEDIAKLLEQLLAINASAVGTLERADRSASSLSGDIAAAAREFGALEHVAGTLRDVVSGLEGIAVQARAASSGSGSDAALLDQVRLRYTTERERITHRLVTSGGAADPGVLDEAAAAPAGGEFGDNVELF